MDDQRVVLYSTYVYVHYCTDFVMFVAMQADELFAQVMETRKRVLEGEHSDKLTSMSNLAHNAGPTIAKRIHVS